jgi:hypothetical protein
MLVFIIFRFVFQPTSVAGTSVVVFIYFSKKIKIHSKIMYTTEHIVCIYIRTYTFRNKYIYKLISYKYPLERIHTHTHTHTHTYTHRDACVHRYRPKPPPIHETYQQVFAFAGKRNSNGNNNNNNNTNNRMNK